MSFDPKYPAFRAPVKRTETPSSFPPPTRERRPPSLTGESDPERIARLERSEEILQRDLHALAKRVDQADKALSARVDLVEDAETKSSVRELLREAEQAKAKLEREKAEAAEQKRIDAQATAELTRALAKEAARRTFKYSLAVALIMFLLGVAVTRLLQ